MDTGSKLRIARYRANLSQRELAAQANVSLTTVVDAERGQKRPQGGTLAKIAKVLDLDLEELLDLADRDGRQSA